MPYSNEHKKQSRNRILQSAAQHFLRQGYERSNIDAIMQSAGLTRGAFRAHFKNKKDLYSKAMAYAAAKGRFARLDSSPKKGLRWLDQMLSVYLSEQHGKDEQTPCPMAFLVNDVVNQEPEVRRSYTRIYKKMNAILDQHLGDMGLDKSQQVYAITAMMIGGVALSNAITDEKMAKQLLKSCRLTAKQIIEAE